MKRMLLNATKKKTVFTTTLCGTAMGFSGCCDDVCRAYDDLKADLANSYAVCCQTQTDDGWSECIQNAQDRHNQLRDSLIAAEAVCRNDNDDLMRQILEEFYQVLRGRLVDAVGPTGLESGQEIANTFVVLGPQDHIDCVLPTTTPITTEVSTQTMLVDNIRYPLESAGVAIEAATKLSDDGAPPLTANEPSADYPAQIWQFDQSGTVHVLAGPYDRTLSVQNGSLKATSFSDAQQTRNVPTAFKLALAGGGITATIQLDPTCPYNELVLDAQGTGWLGMGVDLTSNSAALSRLDMLGTFWMKLPIQQLSNGELLIDTQGWTVGTEVFPIQSTTMSIVTGQSSAIFDLPNGRDEACADTNENGIRDGADELINNYDQFTDCP